MHLSVTGSEWCEAEGSGADGYVCANRRSYDSVSPTSVPGSEKAGLEHGHVRAECACFTGVTVRGCVRFREGRV